MSVGTAREAYASGEWRRVVDALEPDRADLEPADLVLLSDAFWWLGDSPTSMAVSEELFQRLLDQPDGGPAAAERAIRLSLEWFTRGDLQIGEAWLARARRLLAEIPVCPLHGQLVYCEAAGDLEVTGDPAPAAEAAERIAELATRFDDPTLRCFSFALRGLAAIRGGDTAAGFGWLDEAMLPVLGGQVGPLWSGDLYCTVVHLCDDLADLARMRSWTGAMARWSGRLPTSFMFAGVTRIHELQLLMAEGDWDTVERELGERSSDLVGAHGWLAAEGYYVLGEVRRLRGDLAGAREAYSSARGLGHEAQPGEALLLVADGRLDDALAQLRISLADEDRIRRARVLPAAVDVALACDELTYAARLVVDLESTADRFGTAGLQALAAEARAALDLSIGEPTAALGLLWRAAGVYREQRNRPASARVHERLAAAHDALGESEIARAETATAVAIYSHLGAVPDLERLAPRGHPGGLTDREVEVLRLVATGRVNREVAAALGISTKTVSRHLANIFTKIDVTTRTAASAWARENRL